MADRACPNVITGCGVPADEPLANISAELPDGPLPPPPPPPPPPEPEPPPPDVEAPPVEGFIMWLNSEEGLFQDTAGTTPSTNDTPVARWEDQSGNGNHAVDEELSNIEPPWYTTDVAFNGLPVVEYPVTSKWRLATGSPVNMGTSGMTVFVVAAFISSPEVFPTLFGYNGTESLLREFNQTRRIESYFNPSGTQATAADTYNFDEPYVFAFRLNVATQLRTYRNGVAVATAVPAGAQTAAGKVCVGGREDDIVNSFFRGYMAEFLVYPEPLSDDEVDQVNDFLMAKYAIS